MKLILKDSASMQFLNSQNVNIEKLDIQANHNPYIIIKGEKSKNITIRSINPGDKIKTVIGEETDKKTINIL
jgi:hypothetical protein